MSINLDGYGPTAGSYMGGTGANYNERGYNGNSTTPGGNSGSRSDGIGKNTSINIASTKSYNGNFMSMCVNNLKAHEGFKNSMYKDQNGNVTVGIGHLLANASMAAALPFTTTRTYHGHGDEQSKEVTVSKSDITNAFNSYKNSASTAPLTGWHLSNDAVIGQCISDVQNAETGLRNLYSGYDSFSNSRKTALVDMAFNLGIDKLRKGFPKFNAAVNSGDWEAAARESHRDLNQRGDQRNRDTAAQLRSSR